MYLVLYGSFVSTTQGLHHLLLVPLCFGVFLVMMLILEYLLVMCYLALILNQCLGQVMKSPQYLDQYVTIETR